MGDLMTQGSEQKSLAAEDETSQYLTFLASNERFAIGILDVKELIEINTMTQVPMTPDFIRGVINLRGSVVPVIDLASRLGRDISTLTKRSCIVLTEVALNEETQTIGMLVDEVNEILEISQTHLQPPPNFGAEIRTDFIKAMGRVDEEFIILLDINHVLSIEELSVLEQIADTKNSLPKNEPDDLDAMKTGQNTND